LNQLDCLHVQLDCLVDFFLTFFGRYALNISHCLLSIAEKLLTFVHFLEYRQVLKFAVGASGHERYRKNEYDETCKAEKH